MHGLEAERSRTGALSAALKSAKAAAAVEFEQLQAALERIAQLERDLEAVRSERAQPQPASAGPTNGEP